MQIGELKHGTRFYVYSSCNDKDDKPFLCEYDEHYPGTIWCIDDDMCKFNYKIDFMRILNYKVEILEEKEIKLLDPNEGYFKDGTEWVYREMYNKINEIVYKINELNK